MGKWQGFVYEGTLFSDMRPAPWDRQVRRGEDFDTKAKKTMEVNAPTIH